MKTEASASREGGCLCGAVRYRVTGEPVRSSACHCTYCQRRTGSAFGVGAYFRDNDVEIMRGDLKTYEYRSDESGRWLKTQFCTGCGTTVTWTMKGRNDNFIGKAFCLVMGGPERMVGPDFEKGLAQMKAVVERKVAAK